MSAERKKLLWISIGLGVLVLIVLASGFFLMAPKKGGSDAPASIGNSAPPKAQDPQDYLSAPPPAPSLEQPHSQDGGVIIVYGDKPTTTNAAPSAPGAASPGTQAAVPASAEKGGAAESAPDAAAPSEAAPAPKAAAPASKAPAPKASAPAPKKAATAAPKSVSVKVDEYWIQAASFTSRGRADELKDSLSEKGMAAIISVKDISGKNYYRVRIGPYSAKAEADGWLGRLKELPGCAEAYVSKSTVLKKK
jgi:DedD protein